MSKFDFACDWLFIGAVLGILIGSCVGYEEHAYFHPVPKHNYFEGCMDAYVHLTIKGDEPSYKIQDSLKEADEWCTKKLQQSRSQP